MAGQFDSIPFYGAYLARKQQIENEQANQLGTVGKFATLQDHFRKVEAERQAQERLNQFRSDLALAKTPDEQRAVAVRYADPKSILGMSMPKAPEGFTLNQGDVRFAPDGTELARNPRDPRSDPQRSPYYTFISTPNGIVAADTRTGQVVPVVVGGQRVMKAPDDPGNRGAIAAATTTGTAQAKRAFNMAGIGATIKRAEDVLRGIDPNTGKKRPTPTESGVGTIVDKVGAFFGASPEGSVEAQDLKAIAGALTSKMPRMEGPQSDRDTQLYRESAAEIGDSTVPIARRMRALETVKMLWEKYETLNPDAFAGGQTTPQPSATPGLPSMDAIEAELRRRRGGR